jgi:hypothetical protein
MPPPAPFDSRHALTKNMAGTAAEARPRTLPGDDIVLWTLRVRQA